ncbi:MAG TPA: hypothetical protein VMD59_23730 [Acidimicrobiales bacterium]|nr:hypothetical protein [Acidimicrobiales bacterium]
MSTRTRFRFVTVATLALGSSSLAAPLLLAAPAGAAPAATPTPSPAPICRSVVLGGSSETACVALQPGGAVATATGRSAHLYRAALSLSTAASIVTSPVVPDWNGVPPITTPLLRGAGPFCGTLTGAITPTGPSIVVLRSCAAGSGASPVA